MTTPTITIIIPTFNAHNTLDEALNSIVQQTYTNWEVLIMDGLSTDNTLIIAQKYAAQFSSKIKIQSKKDKGIYDAMNKGIQLAKGEWLYFMGSDDTLYEPTTLEKVVALKELKNNDVVYGNVTSPRFNGIYAGEFTPIKLFNQNICHQAIFFNKGMFKTIGKFNLKYKLLADWHHNICWFYSKKIKKYYINLIIANYGIDGLSSSNVDVKFENDKLSIFFFNGFKVFNLSKLIEICSEIILNSKNNNNLHRVIFYTMSRFMLRKIRKYKTKNN
ncbi:glycosyltransferase family 2 protein [uncultured Lutibacter sp.]|uniref:glycosyltransferase family 2 protein n=1 Tax=uncultured Lutibacter sp. TaxID=437739 RepID=UPI00262DD6AB|nr:glycosyltransferase family 2 protein [uncultured Lutibacter sp.]